MRARHLIVIFAAGALVSTVAYGVWRSTSSNRGTAHANLVTRDASKAELRLLTAAQPKPPPCPQSNGDILKPSPQTGHHKVILTWNANPYSNDPHHRAVGYCLYRSEKQNVAATDPKCRTCEQINQNPISDTACVDDLVQDNKKYYYVATAVNEYGEASSLSKETLAEIPPATQVTHPASATSYPRCRQNNGSQ
jgi:hypothetical protein